MKDTRTFIPGAQHPDLRIVVGKPNGMNTPVALEYKGQRLRKYRIGNIMSRDRECAAREAFRRYFGHVPGKLMEVTNG